MVVAVVGGVAAVELLVGWMPRGLDVVGGVDVDGVGVVGGWV